MARPEFALPAPAGVVVVTQTYNGHGDTDYITSCKCDMYFLSHEGGPWDWPTFPLGEPEGARDSMVADVTFRLALIARLAGRPLELV